MSHYVYSTLTADTIYAEYQTHGVDIPVETARVTIKGGAGVASKHLVTPLGVVTQISDEELAILEKNPTFKLHVKGNYVRVEKRNVAVEKVVKNEMTARDKSSPKIPEDFTNSKLKPKTNLQ